LKLEQLVEYESREHESFERYLKGVSEGRTDQYPAPHRFNKLSYPVANRAHKCSLWAQVPLSGSLVVPIFPVDQNKFEQTHRFDSKDFPKLLDFSKDTGRIQFVLGAPPTQFEKFEYLDVLLEQGPPMAWAHFPFEGIDQRSLIKWRIEFETASNAAFFPDLVETFARDGFTIDTAYSRFSTLEWSYLWLRMNGLDDVADKIIDYMAVDPDKAHKILYFYNSYVVSPAIQTMPMINNLSYNDLRMFKAAGGRMIPTDGVVFPGEIGAFLLRKLTPIPDGFESCKVLAERYQQNDLHGLLQRLSSSISTSDVDLAKSSANEVGEVLDKVWEESGQIGRRIKGVSYGVSFSVSAIGFLAGQLLGGSAGTILGLLSGLGFHVLDQSSGAISERVGKKAVLWRSKSYTTALFDFRKKYRLAEAS